VRITLAELEVRKSVISRTYQPGTLNFHGTELQEVKPLRVEAVAELVGGEIRIRGQLATAIEVPCDRCLTSATLAVDRGFDLFYRPLRDIPREEEFEIPSAELDLAFFSGDGIELADVLTEQVQLAVPMKVVCQPDCKGLCGVCGADRNKVSCNCREIPSDSPFGSLGKSLT